MQTICSKGRMNSTEQWCDVILFNAHVTFSFPSPCQLVSLGCSILIGHFMLRAQFLTTKQNVSDKQKTHFAVCFQFTVLIISVILWRSSYFSLIRTSSIWRIFSFTISFISDTAAAIVQVPKVKHIYGAEKKERIRNQNTLRKPSVMHQLP